MPCCLEMSGASWNGIATPSWYFLMLLGDVSAHLDISTAPCHAAKISIHVLVSFLRASWQLRDSSWLFLTSSFSFTPIFRSLQEQSRIIEKPSRSRWDVVKKDQEVFKNGQDWSKSHKFFEHVPRIFKSSWSFRPFKNRQEVSRIGYRSRQEVSRHKFRYTSCSNSYSGTGASGPAGQQWLRLSQVHDEILLFLWLKNIPSQ